MNTQTTSPEPNFSRNRITAFLVIQYIGWFIFAVEVIFWIMFQVWPNLTAQYVILKNIYDMFSGTFKTMMLFLLTVLVPLGANIAIGFAKQEHVVNAAAVLPDQAKQISESAERIKEHELTTTTKALLLIGEFLKLGASDVRLHPAHAESSRVAMEAVACNLRNWEEQVKKHFDNGKDDEFLTEVWIRSQSAYFIEEGFDVGKKVLATNGRNLCFVLLAALDALIENSGGRKVCYTAVTPVNPKDWYNWPHGRDEQRRYYENNFIGDYYRVLREIVNTHRDRLNHSRLILCYSSDKDTEEIETHQPFGWRLDSSKDLRRNLSGRIIPFSIPYDTNFMRSLKLHDYIIALTNEFKLQTTDLKRCSFVPLDGWDISPTSATLTGEQIGDLIEKVTRYHRDRVVNLKDELSVLLEGLKEVASNALEDACSKVDVLLNIDHYDDENAKKEVLRWLQKTHNAEAHVAGHPDIKRYAIQHMRSHFLRYLDHFYYDEKCIDVCTVFAKQLHTSAEDCYIVELDKSQIKERFTANNIEPEFHLFGYEDEGDETGERHNKNDWKLCITATLDYPFEVTKLSLCDDDNSIGDYKAVLAFLESGEAKHKTIANFLTSDG